MRQRTVRNSRKKSGVAAVLRLLAPEYKIALEAAYACLEELGAEPVICGGFAVGVHGAPRMTEDLDFLVSDGVYASLPGALIVTLKPGVPIEVAGIPVDIIPESDEVTTADAVEVDGYRVVSIPALLSMKLAANRPKDRWDVGALIMAGVVDERTAEAMEGHWPDHATRLLEMLAQR